MLDWYRYIYIYISCSISIVLYLYIYIHIFAICHNTLYLIYVNNIEQLYVVCIYIYIHTKYHYVSLIWSIFVGLFMPSAQWTAQRHHTAVHLGPPRVPKMPLSTLQPLQPLQPWHSVEGYSGVCWVVVKKYAEIWVYGNHIHGHRWLSMDILYLWYNYHIYPYL